MYYLKLMYLLVCVSLMLPLHASWSEWWQRTNDNPTFWKTVCAFSIGSCALYKWAPSIFKWFRGEKKKKSEATHSYKKEYTQQLSNLTAQVISLEKQIISLSMQVETQVATKEDISNLRTAPDSSDAISSSGSSQELPTNESNSELIKEIKGLRTQLASFPISTSKTNNDDSIITLLEAIHLRLGKIVEIHQKPLISVEKTITPQYVAKIGHSLSDSDLVCLGKKFTSFSHEPSLHEPREAIIEISETCQKPRSPAQESVTPLFIQGVCEYLENNNMGRHAEITALLTAVRSSHERLANELDGYTDQIEVLETKIGMMFSFLRKQHRKNKSGTVKITRISPTVPDNYDSDQGNDDEYDFRPENSPQIMPANMANSSEIVIHA
jgi:prefoldin subunit 5